MGFPCWGCRTLNNGVRKFNLEERLGMVDHRGWQSRIWKHWISREHLSRTRHVKPGLNPRGPSRKAKYSLMTDSELSSASERWKVPRLGEWNSIWNHVPTSGWSPMICSGWQRAFCIMIRRVVVCSLVKVLRTGAPGKPSVNSANIGYMPQTRTQVIYPWAGWSAGYTAWRTEPT